MTGCVITAKLVSPLPQKSWHRGSWIILPFTRTESLGQREDRKKDSVPEPAAGAICAEDAKQEAQRFAVLHSQSKQDTARSNSGPLRIHKPASGSCGGHVSPNCVLFNLALQTAKFLLSWLESPISHLGGTYLFSWIGN